MKSNVIVRFLLFFLILFVLDLFTGSMLRALYTHQKRGTNFRTNYLINDCKSEIIILGSSRARNHYVSTLISEEANLSCYNGGRDGTLFDYTYACAMAILDRHQPKIIIIDVDFSDFYKIKRLDENLISLLPYYKSNTTIKSVIDDVRGPMEKYKHLSFTYPFNSTFLNSFSNIVRPLDSSGQTGYKPLWGSDVNKLDSISFKGVPLNSRRIKYLDRLAERCSQKGIKLHVVQSPRFAWYTDIDDVNPIFEKISFLYDVNIHLFYNKKEYISHPEWFKDLAHLNHNGASVFTQEIISKLFQNSVKSF